MKRKRKGAARIELQPAPPAPGWMRWGLPALVAAASFAAFLPALRNGFVNWDDEFNFLQNPYYRGLGLEQLKWMFADFSGHYMPLTWVTQGADYVLWGMNPRGYHFTSMWMHALATVLFFFMVLRLLRAAWRGTGGDIAASGAPVSEQALYWGAAAGTLFFGVHPLRVESVVWATERRDVLSGLFILVSVLAYLRASQPGGSAGLSSSADRVSTRPLPDKPAVAPSRRGFWLTVSVAAFLCSLLSKTAGMGLPLVLLALDIYPLRRVQRERWERLLLEKIPFIALMGTAMWMAGLAQVKVGAFYTAEDYTHIDRLVQPGYRLCFYLWKTALPLDLSPLYVFESTRFTVAPKYIVCGLLAAGITVALFLLRRRWPAGLAAWFCYGTLLGPVIGLVQVGPHFAADRYTYLACMPWAVLAGGAVARLLGARASRLQQPVVLAGSAVVLAILGVLAYRQSETWKDSMTLWTHALEVDPSSAMARNYLGNTRKDQGDLNGAIADYTAALKLQPGYMDALDNRGSALHKKGDFDGAIADYTEVLRINPRFDMAYNNRGLSRANKGDITGAIADYDEALKLNAHQAEAYLNRGNARGSRGDYDGAIADYSGVIQNSTRLLDPVWIAQAHHNRGLMKAMKGDLDGAVADYSEALRFDPSYPEAYADRGQARLSRGDSSGAVADLEAALKVAKLDWPLRKKVEAMLTSAKRR